MPASFYIDRDFSSSHCPWVGLDLLSVLSLVFPHSSSCCLTVTQLLLSISHVSQLCFQSLRSFFGMSVSCRMKLWFLPHHSRPQMSTKRVTLSASPSVTPADHCHIVFDNSHDCYDVSNKKTQGVMCLCETVIIRPAADPSIP